MAVPELVVVTTGAKNDGPSQSPSIPLSPDEASLFKQRLQISVRRYWDSANVGATVDGENNRVKAIDLVYTSMTGKPGLDDPDWQLRRYPLNLVDWPSVNSHRLDVRLNPDWLRCSAAACDTTVVSERVLPADEAISRGSSDFVTEAATNSVDGGGGHLENAPNAWLLVYWMDRYYASLSE